MSAIASIGHSAKPTTRKGSKSNTARKAVAAPITAATSADALEVLTDRCMEIVGSDTKTAGLDFSQLVVKAGGLWIAGVITEADFHAFARKVSGHAADSVAFNDPMYSVIMAEVESNQNPDFLETPEGASFSKELDARHDAIAAEFRKAWGVPEPGEGKGEQAPADAKAVAEILSEFWDAAREQDTVTGRPFRGDLCRRLRTLQAHGKISAAVVEAAIWHMAEMDAEKMRDHDPITAMIDRQEIELARQAGLYDDASGTVVDADVWFALPGMEPLRKAWAKRSEDLAALCVEAWGEPELASRGVVEDSGGVLDAAYKAGKLGAEPE